MNRSLALAVTLLTATLQLRAAETSPVVPPPGSEPQWIEVLKSGAGRKEKHDACRFLAIVGTRAALPTLVGLLEDPDLSHMALYALQNLPDPGVEAALRDALKRCQGRPLLGVITTLGVRRDPEAVKPLAARLTDPDPLVVQTSARALGTIGSAAAAKALRGALPKAAAGTLPALQEGLLRCADALVASGDRKTASELYDQLFQPANAHQVRAAAVRGAILTRKDGLKVLAQRLQDPDYVAFAAAARAALEWGPADVTRTLTGALPALAPDRQIVILQTLGRRGDATALPAVQKLAQSGAKPVRLAALRTVAELGQSSAARDLAPLLADPDREIAQSAQDSLAGLPGAEADAAVLALLTHSEASRRTTGLELIGRRRLQSALPKLLQCTTDADGGVRAAAWRQLGELGTPAEVPALLERLSKATQTPDLNAIEQALGSIAVRAPANAQVTMPIAAAVEPAAPPQKVALIRTLSAVGDDRALRTIEAQMGHADAAVRTAAIRAFSEWKTPEAAPTLLAVAQVSNHPEEKLLALRGYLSLMAQLDLPAADRLAMAREAGPLVKRDEERKLLLSALGRAHAPDALPLITSHLENPALRDEAAAAVLSVAQQLMAGQDAAAIAALPGPLDQAAQATGNSDLAKKARKLADEARGKAAGK